MNCKICGFACKNNRSLSLHLANAHKIKMLDYFIEYESFIMPKCKYCNNNAQHYKGIEFRITCGDKQCIASAFRDRITTDDTRKRISNSMKITHANGNHPGWSFKNNDTNRRSYPEKWFIENVIKKYELDKKYKVVEKMSCGKYFLDFAILEKKIDIEIDGQQHFRNQESIDNDMRRNLYLEKEGWLVYRIAWSEINRNSESVVSSLLNWLNASDKCSRYYEVHDVIKQTIKPKYGTRHEYFDAIKENRLQLYKTTIESLKTSTIDFSKFGWVSAAADIIKIKPQKVNSWMKKYMNDFYEEKCFKRKWTCSSNG